MATSVTTDSDLIDGVGTFEPVEINVLERLTPQQFRDKGRATYHQRAWTRTVEDLELQGVDEDYIGTTAQTELKAAVCHLVMFLLHRSNRRSEDDYHNMKMNEHKNEYDRILHSKEFTLTTGSKSLGGHSIRIVRS